MFYIKGKMLDGLLHEGGIPSGRPALPAYAFNNMDRFVCERCNLVGSTSWDLCCGLLPTY